MNTKQRNLGILVFFVIVAGSASNASTYYASLNVIPRTAIYSKLIDIGSAANVSGITA